MRGAQDLENIAVYLLLIAFLTKNAILVLALWPLWKRPWLSFPLIGLLSLCLTLALCSNLMSQLPKVLQHLIAAFLLCSLAGILYSLVLFTPILSLWVFYSLKTFWKRLIYPPLALFDLWITATFAFTTPGFIKTI